MSKIGVLVANGSRAKFIHYHGIHHSEPSTQPLEILERFTHPDSRRKCDELVSDRPGRYQSVQHLRGAYAEDRNPKEETKEQFATELAKKLNDYRTHDGFDKFLIVAPAHFYGLIEKHLPREVTNLIYGTLQKDYTEYKERELYPVLKKALVPSLH